MIVLDASLAVKLMIDETDSADARRWFATSDEAIVAPDLIAIEVAQAVVRRVNAQEFTIPAGQLALSAWGVTLDSGAIGLLRSESDMVGAAAELAMRLGHPVKDCLYLALAIDLDCDLVTCDAKFQAKASPLYPVVKLLAEFN